MLILTATAASQGHRDNDYDWAIEGELVWVEPPCGRDERDPDGGCGCGRGFAGSSSHRATTTAMVRDLPLSRADVIAARLGYLESAGWGRFVVADVADEVDELLDAAGTLCAGDIVERRLDTLRVRARTH